MTNNGLYVTGGSNDPDPPDENNGKWFWPLALTLTAADLWLMSQADEWSGKTPQEFDDYSKQTEFEILSRPEVEFGQGIEIAPVTSLLRILALVRIQILEQILRLPVSQIQNQSPTQIQIRTLVLILIQIPVLILVVPLVEILVGSLLLITLYLPWEISRSSSLSVFPSISLISLRCLMLIR